MKTFHLVILFFILLSPLLHADTWSRADVYFTDWDVMTRESRTVDRARKLAEHKKVFIKDASQIVDLLELDLLKEGDDRSEVDVRLVIDLYTDIGAKVTYHASRFQLCSEGNAQKRRLSKKFLNRIRDLMEKPQPRPKVEQ